MGDVTTWVTDKLATDHHRLKVVERTPEGLLVVRTTDDYTFSVAVLGVQDQDVVQVSHLRPLFGGANKPQLVINVPSKTLWSGASIDFLHSLPAAFGTMGDIDRAARTKAAEFFRDKKMGYFITAMEQHKNVSAVSYVYDSVFRADRWNGASVTVAVVDAYNMSAEDVRNARTRVGHFDVVVKSSSLGSISPQAEAAAVSMGAEALTFRELMLRLTK
jgi:hypothetical protein